MTSAQGAVFESVTKPLRLRLKRSVGGTPAARPVTPPAPTLQPVPADALVIENGTLIDGTGAAPIPDGMLVIRGDRIMAVGRAADFATLASWGIDKAVVSFDVNGSAAAWQAVFTQAQSHNINIVVWPSDWTHPRADCSWEAPRQVSARSGGLSDNTCQTIDIRLIFCYTMLSLVRQPDNSL